MVRCDLCGMETYVRTEISDGKKACNDCYNKLIDSSFEITESIMWISKPAKQGPARMFIIPSKLREMFNDDKKYVITVREL